MGPMGEEAHRQSAEVAASEHAADDQAYIDALILDGYTAAASRSVAVSSWLDGSSRTLSRPALWK